MRVCEFACMCMCGVGGKHVCIDNPYLLFIIIYMCTGLCVFPGRNSGVGKYTSEHVQLWLGVYTRRWMLTRDNKVRTYYVHGYEQSVYP